MDNVSSVEFWQLDRTAGAGDARVSLYWENVSYSGIDNCADLTIARWNGSTWVECPATFEAGSSCSGAGTGTVLTNAVVTNFSPFTFGSKLPGVNPLPLDLLSFSASCEGKTVKVQWTTVNERNTSSFGVERSRDGINFQSSGTVEAKGRKAETDYAFEEQVTLFTLPLYYRLKLSDKDGSFRYSQIVAATCEPGTELSAFPNPNSGEFLVDGLKAGATIEIYDAAGALVAVHSAESSQKLLTLPSAGLYLLLVKDGGYQQSMKVVMR